MVFRRGTKCIVTGCKDYVSKRQRLPHPGKCPEKFITWLEIVGRTDLFNEDPLRLYEVKRICKKHFSPKCYYANYEKLRPDAVPDLFIPDNDDPPPDITNVLPAPLPVLPSGACTYGETDTQYEKQKGQLTKAIINNKRTSCTSEYSSTQAVDLPSNVKETVISTSEASRVPSSTNKADECATFIKTFYEILNSKLEDSTPSKSSEVGEGSAATPATFVTSEIPKTFKRVNILPRNAPINTGFKTTLVRPSLPQPSRNATLPSNTTEISVAAAHNTPRAAIQPSNTVKEKPRIGSQNEPSAKPSSPPIAAPSSSDTSFSKISTPNIYYDDHAYLATTPKAPSLVSDGMKCYNHVEPKKPPSNAGPFVSKTSYINQPIIDDPLLIDSVVAEPVRVPVESLLVVGDETSLISPFAPRFEEVGNEPAEKSNIPPRVPCPRTPPDTSSTMTVESITPVLPLVGTISNDNVRLLATAARNSNAIIAHKKTGLASVGTTKITKQSIVVSKNPQDLVSGVTKTHQDLAASITKNLRGILSVVTKTPQGLPTDVAKTPQGLPTVVAKTPQGLPTVVDNTLQGLLIGTAKYPQGPSTDVPKNPQGFAIEDAKTPQGLATGFTKNSQHLQTDATKTPQVIATVVTKTQQGLPTGVAKTPHGLSTVVAKTPQGLPSLVDSTLQGRPSGVPKNPQGFAIEDAKTPQGLATGVTKNPQHLQTDATKTPQVLATVVTKTPQGLPTVVDSTLQGLPTVVDSTLQGLLTGTAKYPQGIPTDVAKNPQGLASGVTNFLQGHPTVVPKTPQGHPTVVAKTSQTLPTSIAKTSQGLPRGVSKTPQCLPIGAAKTSQDLATSITKTPQGHTTGSTKTSQGLATGVTKTLPGLATGVTMTLQGLGTNVTKTPQYLGSGVTKTPQALSTGSILDTSKCTYPDISMEITDPGGILGTVDLTTLDSEVDQEVEIESTWSDPGPDLSDVENSVDIEEQIPSESGDNHPIMSVQTTKDTIQTYVDPLACVSTSMSNSGTSGNETAEQTSIPPVNHAPCETPLNALKTHNIKVLGDDDKLSDPAVLSSLLNKVQLKKKGTIYVLPVKPGVDLGRMTKSQLQNLVRRNVSGSPNKPLLKLAKKKPPRKRFRKKKWPTETNRCTCCKPCLRSGRRLSRFGILTKVEGNIFEDFPEFDLSQAENVFNVSTILTDLDNKSQVEQLCQLIIENVFKLRHVSMNRKVGSLTVFFANKSYGKYKRINKNNVLANSNSSETQSHDNDSTVQNTSLILNEEVPENINLNPNISSSENTTIEIPTTVIETEFGPCEIRLKTSDTNPPPLQNTTSLNMSTISTESTEVTSQTPSQDHSRPSQELKAPPKKPNYVVHLIDVDNYTLSTQKPNRIKRPFRTKDYRRLLKSVTTLRDLIKKKNDRLKVMYGKIDNLKRMLREIKGVKRLFLETKKRRAAPKTLEAENQNASDSGNLVIDAFANFPDPPPVKIKKPRRKRKLEFDPNENNAAVLSISPEKRKKKRPCKEKMGVSIVDTMSVKSPRKTIKTNSKKKINNPEFAVSEVHSYDRKALTGQEMYYQETPCKIRTEIVDDEEFNAYQDMYDYLIEEYSGESSY